MRWFLLAAAAAPVILAYFIVTSHKLSYPPASSPMSSASR